MIYIARSRNKVYIGMFSDIFFAGVCRFCEIFKDLNIFTHFFYLLELILKKFHKKIKSNSITYLQKGRKISFALDTGFSEKIITNVKKSNLLICESTYTNTQKDQALKHKHLTAKQAASIAKKSKSKKLILTHISQRYTNLKHISGEATKTFKNTIIAKDLDVVEI